MRRVSPRLLEVSRDLRDAALRSVSRLEGLVRRDGELIPPAHLRRYYYRTFGRRAYVRACETARTEVMIHGLRPEHDVLDIGCGVGNLAVGILDYLTGAYAGVDVNREAIDWCGRAITARCRTFTFHHADVYNEAYNRRGAIDPAQFTFPFPAGRFDFAFAGSLFTHLLPDSAERYISEIARLLRPSGVCVASFFLLNRETRTGVEAGRSFLPYAHGHPSGRCRLMSNEKPEAAVALEEGFVRAALERAGLRVGDVRRGRWWSGGQDDQDVLTIHPAT